MDTNSIIFLSTYSYLSNPQYFAIAPKIKKYQKIYFNPNDPISFTFDKKNINKHEILQYFDVYHELKPMNFSVIKLLETIKVHIKYKRILKSYLDKIGPKAVISCSDMTLSDRIIFQWCLKNKIPFIILQPSFIDDINYRSYGIKHRFKYILFNKILNIPLYRKQNIYGNESQKTYLFLWGRYFVLNPTRKNTFFVGNPAFDEIFNQFEPRNEIKNSIVICTQDIDKVFGKEEFKLVKRMYIHAIRSKPELTFYIKVHPRESIDKYKGIFEKYNFSNVNIVKDIDLYELFRKCDAQISISSFTSFEAAALGLPVIILNPNDQIYYFDHFKGKINFRVTKIEDLPKAIDLVLTEEYYRKFLKNRKEYFNTLFYSIDGNSSQRVVNKINELISENH